MNYTLANTGGGGSITQLKYLEIDLTGQSFVKLNSNPITLIPAGSNTIIPISTTVSYRCTSFSIPVIMIGFEPLLYTYLTSCWYDALGLGDKILSSQYDNFTTGGSGYNNIVANNPLVLYAFQDDPNLDFTYFKINILYLEVTNLP